jgi:hypothetical protein
MVEFLLRCHYPTGGGKVCGKTYRPSHAIPKPRGAYVGEPCNPICRHPVRFARWLSTGAVYQWRAIDERRAA